LKLGKGKLQVASMERALTLFDVHLGRFETHPRHAGLIFQVVGLRS
jgi:hypothetical protein